MRSRAEFVGLLVLSITVMGAPAESGQFWFDSFEDYLEEDYLAGSGIWETWSGGIMTAEDAIVTDEIAATGTNSLLLNGVNDVVAIFHEKNDNEITEGICTIGAKVYVPDDQTGNLYFILMNRFVGGQDWSSQIRMNAGTGLITYMNGAATELGSLPLITDEWVEIRVEADLDNNLASAFYDDEPLVLDVVWDHDDSDCPFEAIDLYSDSSTDCYYDDVYVCLGPDGCEEEPPEAVFIRGDADGNGAYTIGDGIQILEFLFADRQALDSDCPDTADVDDNGTYTIGDAVWLLNFQFASGQPPADPASVCGEDTTPDSWGPETCKYPADSCP